MYFLENNITTIQIGILIFASILNLSLSFLFSLVETSLMITDDVKFQALINREINHKKKKRLKKILQRRDKHGAALSVAITLTNVTGSSILGSMASKYLPSQWVILFTILITYFMLVFARTIPKIYARKINHQVLLKFNRLIRFNYFISIPILWFTLIWVKIFGLNKNNKKPTISELKEIVNVYQNNGVIKTTEGEIFENMFNVRDHDVSRFIKKKKIIEVLHKDSNILDYKDLLIRTQNKKFFVADENEKIIGIVHYKDLIHSLLNEENQKVKEYLKLAKFVNKGDLIINVIPLLDNKISHIIIVDDEDKALGIASLKDLYFFMAGKKPNKKDKIT